MSTALDLLDRSSRLAPPRLVEASADDDLAQAGLVGASRPMRELRALIQRVASSDRPVLVLGPTGSGKDVVARAIHAASARAGRPLEVLNCAAIPETLMEAELFGCTRGAYTGATEARVGLAETTGSGTLFLDELGELPLGLQAKLLRLLESGTYRPLGAPREAQFRGRVIAATNQDLGRAVQEGSFRADLYFRLGVLVLRVPSLDERREDIPLLARHFAAQQPRRMQLSDGALGFLAELPLHGNVRELKNLIERAAVLVDAEVVEASDLARIVEPSAALGASAPSLQGLVRNLLDLGLERPLKTIENLLVDEALARSDGNKSAAAKLLGVHRKVVERKVHAPVRAVRRGVRPTLSDAASAGGLEP